VGATNLLLEPGDASPSSLFGQVGEGLYVTDVAGLHSGVNPVSGTFSVGASGSLIEGGELGAPVREITIAGDLVGMLRDVLAVGSEDRWIPLGEASGRRRCSSARWRCRAPERARRTSGTRSKPANSGF